ncbi:MAG: hypothetical protein WEB89_09395 [Balneolales bacterium]
MQPNPETQQNIEDYIAGKLYPDQIERLWTQFLEEPEWLDYFKISLGLHLLNEKEMTCEMEVTDLV